MQKSNNAFQIFEKYGISGKKYTATFPEISFSGQGTNNVYYCCKRFAVFVVALHLYT